MEEVEEQRFVCKFCSKSCLSGKSLGGHMRSHLALISAAKNSKLKADNKIDFEDDHSDSGLEENPCFTDNFSPCMQDKGENCSMNLEIDDQDQDSHVLRQNPKKSWKISDLMIKPCQTKGNFCRECGNKFFSSRALAGHMRTHSTLSTKSKCGHLCSKCGRSFDSIKALFGHMKTHSKRYRSSTESNVLSEFEFYHPKKKRSITKYRTSQTFSFSSVKESPSCNENDEAVEEAANSLIMLSMGLNEWDGYNSQPETLSNANSSEIFCSLDKKIEQETHQEDGPSYFQLDDNKINMPSCFTEGGKAGGTDEDEQKCVDTDFDTFNELEKMQEYKCRTCNIIFHSHQALGGHINRHKMMVNSSAPDAEFYIWSDTQSSEIPIEPGNCRMAMTDFEVMRSKKHKCQICFKIFPTGRALGGHKRAHYNGSIEDRIKDIMVDIQDLGDIQPNLNLSLPVIPHRC